MITNAKCVLNLFKEGSYSYETMAIDSDTVSEVVFKTIHGEEIDFSCMDSLMVKVSEDYVDDTVDTYMNDVLQYFEKQSVFNIDNCHLVNMNGVLYRIIKYDGLAFIHNERTNNVQYKCKLDELEKLLESEDRYYESYTKVYQEI